MSKIFVVQSADGDVEASTLGGIKVIYAFEEKPLAETYCGKLNKEKNAAHKVAAMTSADFSEYILPVLRAAQVKAVIFNLLPGEPPTQETYSFDFDSPANPRTYDFQLQRWLTAKEARQARKIQKTPAQS